VNYKLLRKIYFQNLWQSYRKAYILYKISLCKLSGSDLRKRAEEYFKKYPLSDDKIGHSYAVAEFSEKIAQRMKDSGVDVNVDEAWAGAILHEIGLTAPDCPKTEAEESVRPYPEHAVIGAKDAQEAGFPTSVVAAIQNHGGHYNKAECELLEMPLAVVGDTWTSDIIEAKVVAAADEVLFLRRHANPPLDPWKDNSVMLPFKFAEQKKLYKQRLNKDITEDDPTVKRVFKECLELYGEMLQYVKDEDVPAPWKGLAEV